MNNNRAISFLIGSLLLASLCLLLAIYFGSVYFSFAEFRALFSGHGSEVTKTIIFDIRLPEILNAFIVGALLALAGTLMQALLRNPLADPYILGVSGGAATATLCGMLLGFGLFQLRCLAYLGALAAIFLVFILARSPKHWSPVKLLLTGVVLAAGWGAIISFILSISPDSDLHGLLFWLIGNIQGTDFSYSGFVILISGLFISLWIAKPLDLLLHGETLAQTLGVNLKSLYLIIYLLGALLTATAVSIAGTIGFVGLIVPHIIRLCIGSRHRFLIPCSVLIGGSLLILADTAARTLFAPEQLPVGIFTVFIGVPVFLYLLLRGS